MCCAAPCFCSCFTWQDTLWHTYKSQVQRFLHVKCCCTNWATFVGIGCVSAGKTLQFADFWLWPFGNLEGPFSNVAKLSIALESQQKSLSLFSSLCPKWAKFTPGYVTDVLWFDDVDTFVDMEHKDDQLSPMEWFNCNINGYYRWTYMCDYLSSKPSQSPVKALKLEPLVNDHLLLATKTNFWAWKFNDFPCFLPLVGNQ